MEVTDQRTESSLTNSRGPSDPLNNDPMRPERQEGRSRSEVSKYNISLQNLFIKYSSVSHEITDEAYLVIFSCSK